MSGELRLPELVAGREAKFVTDLFEVLGAASDALIAEEKRRKEERRNAPEARLRRSEGARKGWQTRRTREAAEDAAERASWDERPWPSGPLCDGIYHDSRGSERPCALEPDHDGDCDGD